MTNVPQFAIDLIKQFEGYAKKLPDGRIQAYPDPIAGWKLPTIGYGSTKYPDGSPVKKGDIISAAQVLECLQAEVFNKCRPGLEKIPTWNQMNEHQRSALYSFAYNLGAHFYGNSKFKAITLLCDSVDQWTNEKWVAAQFIKYRNPGSSVEAGLRRRRQAEANLFCTPVEPAA